MSQVACEAVLLHGKPVVIIADVLIADLPFLTFITNGMLYYVVIVIFLFYFFIFLDERFVDLLSDGRLREVVL